MAEAVAQGAIISAVNLSEVIAKLSEAGVPEAVIHQMLDPMGLEVVSFDTDLAYQAGMFRPATKHAGLSLGDRACLALAGRLALPALTADRTWDQLNLGVTIHFIR